MGIKNKRVRGRMKYVKLHCDCCGIMYPYTSYQSITKATDAAKKSGWDCSRYFPGDIYRPECIAKYGIKPVTEADRQAAEAAATPDYYLAFEGYTNGTETPKKQKRTRKSSVLPKPEPLDGV